MSRLPRRLGRRLRARLHPDERGFTMMETVIALGIIGSALTALAFTATGGFRYVAFARERQAADGIADQLMEQVRGLSYPTIQQGLKSELLGTDPYVELCGTTYRLHLPGTTSCAGEAITSTSSLADVFPLVPNSGTIGEADGYPVDYSWRTYVTNECPGVSATCTEPTPYRVTIYVAWDSLGVSGVAEKVQTQSYFFSPEGCVSSSTHPFSAPCQPYFFGQARAAPATINVTGTVQNLTFESGSLVGVDAEANVQHEQVSQVQGGLTPTATTLVDDDACEEPLCTDGASSQTAAADDDPSSTTATYATTTLAGGPLSTYTASSVLGTSLTVSNAAGDTGESHAAVKANSTDVCPPTPPAPPTETDNLPCAGTRVEQAGTLYMTAVLNGLVENLGTTTIATIAASGSDTTTLSNRTAVSGQDGNLTDTVVRRLGTVQLGGVPANFDVDDDDWAGAFIILTGYADTVSATAGSSAAAPSATITAGTLKVWNGFSYDTIDLTTVGANGRDYSYTNYDESFTETVGVEPVTVRMQSAAFSMASVPATTSSPSGSGTILRNEVLATVGSPIFGTFTYTVTIDGVTAVNLTIDVNLGTVTAKTIYKQAPTAG